MFGSYSVSGLFVYYPGLARDLYLLAPAQGDPSQAQDDGSSGQRPSHLQSEFLYSSATRVRLKVWFFARQLFSNTHPNDSARKTLRVDSPTESQKNASL